MEELIDSIGSNKIILLEKNEYIFDEPLDLMGIINLTIRPFESTEEVEFIAKPSVVEVVKVTNCDNIVFENIKIGHESDKGCDAPVIEIKDSKNINLNKCRLYGCGTTGVDLERVSGFNFNNGSIYDCSHHIMRVYDSKSVKFEDSDFYENGGEDYYYNKTGLIVNVRSDIIFNRINIYNNKADRAYLFYNTSMYKQFISTEDEVNTLVISDSKIYNNKYSSFAFFDKHVILNNTKVIDETQTTTSSEESNRKLTDREKNILSQYQKKYSLEEISVSNNEKTYPIINFPKYQRPENSSGYFETLHFAIVGWSKDGKIFYLEQTPSWGMADPFESGFIRAYVVDLVTNKTLWSTRISEALNLGIEMNKKPITEIFTLTFDNLGTVFKAKIDEYEIILNEDNKIEVFPFIYNNSRYYASIENVLRAPTEFMGKVIMLNGYEVGLISNRNDMIESVIPSIPEVEIVGYVKSPFEQRVAVITMLVEHGPESSRCAFSKPIGVHLDEK